jgi:ligand-binding sensor domain-containing protein/serine phosphatase RsbU (regulator of sigma subunit)
MDRQIFFMILSKTKYLLIAFLSLCFLQNNTIIAQQYNFKNYTSKNGLASSVVNNIFHDSKGYLWFATQGGGISRFNGKEFKNFTKKDGLIANDVTCIIEDKSGNIWVSTSEGVSKFDGIKFYNYTVKQGLSDNLVFSIYCDNKNNVWFGTAGGGVSIFDGQNFKKISIAEGLSSNMVYAITQDKKGNFWFALENGISKYDGTEITNYDKIKILTNKTFFSILCDSKGDLWFGSVNAGVVKFNGIHFEEIIIPDEVKKDFIGSITEDKHGNIWFATDHGALKFDGNKYTLFNEKKGLSSNRVFSIDTDYEGNVWMGTQQGGVNLFRSEAFVNYTPKDGLISNKITTQFQTKDGEYIIGTLSNGITVFSNNVFSHLTSVPELSQSNISTISIDNKNNLWVGTTDGIFILKKQNGTYVLNNRIKKLNKTSLQQVVNIFHDNKGAMWIATYGAGFFKIDDKEEKQFSKSNGLISDDILTMFKDSKGIIWLGTNDAGVIKFENDKFINYTEKDGLAGKSVWSIAEDDNHVMYFGTSEGGISCNNGQQFKTISTKDGLCSNNITALVWDKTDKSLCIGTDKGINRLKLTADLKVESLRYYGEQEGFKGVEVFSNAILIDDKGLIWFGTTNGLSMFNRKYDFQNLTPPKLHLNNIRLSYQNVDWRKFADSVDLRNNLPYDLVLSHKNNHLTFDFQALTTDNVKYTYILEGQDNDWSPLAANAEANFTNIAPGKTYTFKVKAVNSNNVWSKDLVAFTFTIKPPWWQTWWFYSITIVLIVAGVFGFINYRTAQLAKEKKVLEERVIERTTELKGANIKLSEAIHAITDSLNYAQRIQQSFLTSKSILKQTLKEYFIIYKPRDIVSGDFYWTFDLPDRTLIACADSTGHGIPGAFMSLIGISLLNEISHSKNITEPALILDELRKIIISALNPEQLDSGGKDGMDIALISIFKTSNSDEVKIHFSGANNAMYIVSNQNGTTNFMEFKSDKQPVGFYSNMKPFTQQEIIVKKGDLIYMGTDGFADQFGGEKGKKFMSKQLKNILSSIYNLPLEEQQQSLNKVFNDWKGDLEQVDDVTIIGIKIA